MMSTPRLRLERVKVHDLYEFACRFIERADGQEIVPITRQIALSQSKNPCAGPEDIGLLVAYMGDKCVGHQGLLPVRVTSPAGPGKAFWCTGLYVLPEFRTRLVAVALVRALLSIDQDLVLSEFTEDAGRLFAAMHFQEIPPLEYRKLRVDRLDLLGTPFYALIKYRGARPALRAIGTAGLKLSRAVCYGAVSGAYYAMLLRRGRTLLARYTLTEVDRVRPVDDPRPQAEGTRFPRDTETLNWTLQYPWGSERAARTTPRYFFPETFDIFRDVVVEVGGAGGEYLGFVVLHVVTLEQRTKITVKEYQTGPAVDDEVIFWIACTYAGRRRADSLELPPSLGHFLDDVPLGSLVVQKARRSYLVHPKKSDSVLAMIDQHAILSLSDGDTAFL